MRSLICLLLLAVLSCTKPNPLPTPGQWKALALAPVEGTSKSDLALKHAIKSATDRPDSVDAWVALGQAWITKARSSNDPGHNLSAEAAAELALAINPRSATAMALKSLALLSQHRFIAAQELALKALAIRDDDVLALAALSDAQLELGDLDAAAEAAQRMIDLKPSLPSYGRAAHLRWLRGDVAGAKSLYRLAIDSGRSPQNPEPQAWMIVESANVFLEAGDVAGARAGYEWALQRIAEYPPALVGKARTLLADNDGAQALKLLTRAAEQSPSVETYFLMAEAAQLVGDEVTARSAWSKAESIGLASDHFGLARAWVTADRRVDDAIRLLEEERERRPNLFVEGMLAWALVREGFTDKAAAVGQRAFGWGAPDTRLRYAQATLRAAQGDMSGAREALERLSTSFPALAPSTASEARAQLKRLQDAVVRR